MKKKTKLFLIIISIIVIFLGCFFTLYCLNKVRFEQEKVGDSCIDITFLGKNNINLQEPYEFNITNTCNSSMPFNVNLEILDTSTFTNVEKINVMLSSKVEGIETNKRESLLSDFKLTPKTIDNSVISFNLVTGKLNAKESKNYVLKLWLDEKADVDMTDELNNLFSSKIVVTTNNLETMPSAVETITTLVSGANTSSTDVYTVPDKTSDSCTYTLAYDGTTDNNLRYVGKNPCNYVKIDNEIWRIIGVMNNIDDGTGKKESRIKLIRNESIGNYSWDTSDLSVNNGYGVNEWSQADLMKLLNPGYESEDVGGSLYYNSKSGVCYNYFNNSTKPCDFTNVGLKANLKALVGDTLWHTGTNGINDYTTANNSLASNFYSYERSSNNGKICTSGIACNDKVARTTTWTGKIGLMYPSDYGYATSGGTSMNRASCLDKGLYEWSREDDCTNSNWFYNDLAAQWMLSSGATSWDSSSVFIIRGYYGNVLVSDAGWLMGDAVVLPTVYLISDTSIVSGEGSPESPYRLFAR